jgi:hypothetical protein
VITYLGLESFVASLLQEMYNQNGYPAVDACHVITKIIIGNYIHAEKEALRRIFEHKRLK